MYGEVSKGEATATSRHVPQTRAAASPPEGPGSRARAAATTKMTDSASNETVEERLARVETKTDLVRQDLNEFMRETRSGFSAVRADMREVEIRLCKRQDEATATLRAELKDATDGLRKEFQNTNESLHHTTAPLRKEIHDTAEKLSTGMAEVRGYLKGLYVAIVPLTIAILGLVVHLTLRG